MVMSRTTGDVQTLLNGSPASGPEAKMTDRGEGEQEKSRQFKIPWSPDIYFSSPIAGAPPAPYSPAPSLRAFLHSSYSMEHPACSVGHRQWVNRAHDGA